MRSPLPRFPSLSTLSRWLVLGAVVGVVCGAASALFLWLLERATHQRIADERIVYALPLLGLGLGLAYERFGAPIAAGTGLVIDKIHDGGPEIPLRMAPMVLVGTVLTHLFGGSVGREGAAVQMGASLADYFAHRARVSPETRRQLLAAGVAGGFGSVFGTPFAGAIFGLEFIALGRIEYGALGPALVAALVGDVTTRALGIGHAAYPAPPALALSPSLAAKWLVFACAMALASTVFIEGTHLVKRIAARSLPRLSARMFVGGVVLVLLWKVVGTSDYLGLGVPMIARAFHDPALPVFVFALKIVFTAIALGTGFPGGEVTPLFFIGATLGNVLAQALGLPIELGAGIGLAAVFAAASNAPLALTIMAVELLGANVLPHAALVCVLAYLLSGHRSIYGAQRLFQDKHGGPRRDVAVPLSRWED